MTMSNHMSNNSISKIKYSRLAEKCAILVMQNRVLRYVALGVCVFSMMILGWQQFQQATVIQGNYAKQVIYAYLNVFGVMWLSLSALEGFASLYSSIRGKWSMSVFIYRSVLLGLFTLFVIVKYFWLDIENDLIDDAAIFIMPILQLGFIFTDGIKPFWTDCEVVVVMKEKDDE